MFTKRARLQDESDLALIAEYKEKGQRRYFLEIFDRYNQKIFRICSHIVRDAALAEDLVQETFARALKGIWQFDEKKGQASVEQWLIRICKNLSLDELRRRTRRPVLEPIDPESLHSQLTCPEKQAMLKEALDVLDRLKARHRICYLLFAVEGYTYNEISQITGYRFEEVKAYIRTARRNLEKKFQ